MSDARTITAALRGKWYAKYGLAFCPAHHNIKTPALSLTDGHKGLLVHCFAGCTFEAIAAALRGLGLLEGGGAYAAPDAQAAASRLAIERTEAAKRSAQAFALWRETEPIKGTLAELYLRRRGITCPLPETLRFTPSCWHASAQRLPAMVALVDGVGSFAVLRTYLRPDGSGKAEVEPARAMLGAVTGGAVRLCGGAGPLVIAEGIETGLALASGLLRSPAPVWAALSTSGVRGLHLPPEPGRLTIASDGDAPGRAAAHALAERANRLGWRVSLLPAPDGRDWADILQKKGAAA